MKPMKMDKKITALALVVIAVVAIASFLFYAPSNVNLSVKDPPLQSYDGSISAIVVSFSKIDLHEGDAGNDSGWHTVVMRGSIDLISVLTVSKVLGSASILAGRYNELRLFASTANITIASVTVTYTIASGGTSGLKVPIQGGFQVVGGQSIMVQLDFAFNNSEIMANGNLMLNPVVSATVA